MAVEITIPTALRAYTEKQAVVTVEGDTVDAALRALTDTHPGLAKHLRDSSGKLRSFVNVYLGDEDIRFLPDKEQTALSEGASLIIVPSIAGGVGEEAGEDGLAEAQVDLPELDQWDIARFSRHLILEEVGVEGQRRLKGAKVLCIGTGGLGSPLLLYLAAAGVGRIGIVDFDVVDESNLQRQVVHGTAAVGKPKVQSARERILDINPRCQVDVFEEALMSDNALEIFADYDVVVDGTDNFPTRYLVNDACVILDKPNVYGSIFKFEGQASVFNYVDPETGERGPNYRDLYPEPPPPGLVPSCAEGGVLGILPGVIGCIQATETIKILLGKGQTLSGRLLLYDALNMSFRQLKLRRDPDARPITELIDYQQFCGVVSAEEGAAAAEAEPETFARLDVQQIKARQDAGWAPFVLDVRKPHEADIVSIGADLLRPHEQILAGELDGIPRDRPVLVHCKMGGRSAKAARALTEAGFTDVTNMEGGITAWAQLIDTSLPTY